MSRILAAYLGDGLDRISRLAAGAARRDESVDPERRLAVAQSPVGIASLDAPVRVVDVVSPTAEDVPQETRPVSHDGPADRPVSDGSYVDVVGLDLLDA